MKNVFVSSATFCQTNGKSYWCLLWNGKLKNKTHIIFHCWMFIFLFSFQNLHSYFFMVDEIWHERNANNKTKSASWLKNKRKKTSIKLKIKLDVFMHWEKCFGSSRPRNNIMQNKFSLVSVSVFACYCRFTQHFHTVQNIFFHSFVQFQQILPFVASQKKNNKQRACKSFSMKN